MKQQPIAFVKIPFLFAFLAFSVIFCKKPDDSKNNPNTLAVVTTAKPENVTLNSAELGGYVSSAGTSAVTDRGVCWALHTDPITLDNTASCGSDTGSFVTTVNGLGSFAVYYVRAYATNSSGTAYGNEVQFKTGDSTGTGCPGMATFTDARDGQVYPTVQIGSQCWMKKNLNVGTRIETTVGQNPLSLEKWCYDNNEDNCDIYGGLYQWDVIMQGAEQQGVQGICPDGWHVPTDGEWGTLINYLGGYTPAGQKLKEAGFDHWLSPNTGANDSSHFTALPAGIRYPVDSLTYDLGMTAYFWTSTFFMAGSAWGRLMYHNQDYAEKYGIGRYEGASLRCLKN